MLDLEQEKLARNLGSGHRVIHGVAGSGKTLILGYRCIHLAEMLRKPILVLCFNILRLNYRNTRKIHQFACDFARKFIDAKAADDDHIPMVHPESGGISGPGPAFRQFVSIGDEIARTVAACL